MENNILDFKANPFRKFNHHIGFSFPTPVVIASSFFALIGLVVALAYPIVGLLILVFFGYIGTNTYGFEMDTAHKRCREYTAVFGFRRGSCIPLSDLPYVSVLHENMGSSVASLSNRITTYTETKYNVYLLSKTHRTRLLVRIFHQKDEARAFAENLAEGAGLEYAVYSPQVSSRTRERR